MEPNSLLCKNPQYNQIEEAYCKVVYTYTTQIIHAGRLYRRHNCFKWAQLILSAVTTGGILGTLISNQVILIWIGCVASALMLVLTAYFKDLDLSQIHKKHLDTSNQLWFLRELYLSFLIDFPSLTKEEIAKKRDNLQLQVAKIYEEAPITDSKSYSMAQKALKENESQFFSREEINQLLPETLRCKQK